MHPAPGLVCSDRPEGCLLLCFDPFEAQTVPTVYVRRSGMAVQGPPLRALPVSPCVHEGRRRCPYPVTGNGRQDPPLPRWMAYPSPIQRAVWRSQGLGASAPQPVGASGQLGKKQALSCAENLFSRWVWWHASRRNVPKQCWTCLSSIRGRNVVPLKQFQRLLGHMASADAVTPLWLLHMRPLQHWLHSQVPRWAWHCGTLRVGITQQCCRSHSPWTGRVPLEQVSRHTVVTTDASSTGWGATCNGQAASGLWTGSTEMESDRELVFFSPKRPPKMHDWSSAFFPARKGWSVGCHPPPWKCMWPLSWLTTMQVDESLQVTPCALLGPLYRPGWTSEGPLWATGLSRAEVPVS